MIDLQSLKKGTWCKYCYHERTRNKGLELARKLAEQKGGKCLSTTYKNLTTPMLFDCGKGHQVSMMLGNIRRGSWCRLCYEESLRLDGLRIANEIAAEHKGECLSTSYVNTGSLLQMKCKEGHTWGACLDNLVYGETWCPYCRLKCERKCRDIFEALTGKQFPKMKPKWLQGLELDGFCKELSLAFEYNGAQHYKVVPMWHKNGDEDLEQQKSRDARKIRLCDDNWVTLIIIPYDESRPESFIENQLFHLGYL